MKIFIVSVFLTLSWQAHAWGWKELGEEASVPVTTDAKYFLMGGSALTLLFVVTEDQVGDPFHDKQVRNKTLGHSSGWGDIMGQMVPNIFYVGGMAIASKFDDPKAWDRAVGMFKATAYSASVTTVLKYTIREPRPNDHSTRNSFPSGHSTTVFAFSGYIAGEHGWGWGAPALALSLFTGYSRIGDNMHRIHDVTAGATIGWVYGWGIAKYQKNKKSDAEAAFIVPLLDTTTAGLALYKEF